MVDFYCYRDAVIKELTNQDYEVTCYNDNVPLNAFEKLFSCVFPIYKHRKFDRFFKKTLSDNKYDLVLIVFGGFFFKKKHIALLKETYPHTPIVFYAWDAVKNFPNTKELIESCDYSYTFDQDDAKEFSIPYLPLFYISKGEPSIKKEYDASIIATLFDKKLASVIRVLDCCKNVNPFVYLRVKSKLHKVQMLIKHRKQYKAIEKYCYFKNLSHEQVLDIFNKSKVVIDFPIPHQTGLTIRTIEALALGCKIVTTNSNVKNHDFYSPDNIFIIDDNTKEIPSSFFNEPFNKEFSISEEYSISSFIKKLVNK